MRLLVQGLHFPLILIYLLSFIFPKNKKLVLVGEWGGALKEDNAVSLGRLLLDDGRYTVFFISNSTSDKTKNLVNVYSLKSFWLHLRAGVYIVGSGKKDVLSPFVTSRSLLINTWHGLPIKKILWMSKKDSFLMKVRDVLMPFYDETPDYVVASGDFSEVMSQAFRPKLGVIEIDQPRWFRLKTPTPDARCMLYSPTFRDADLNFFPLSHTQLVELDAFIELSELPRLIITIHPACRFKPDNHYRNILFNGRDCFKDLYSQLLPNAACVVSDLSSVLIEARHFGIRDYCYFPDKLQYVANSRPIIEEVYNRYCATTWDTFIDILVDFRRYNPEEPTIIYEFKDPTNEVTSVINRYNGEPNGR